MYVINDIKLLVWLKTVKLLDAVLDRNGVSMSALKLTQHCPRTIGEIEATPGIKLCYVDADAFAKWRKERHSVLSPGEMSSLYLALTTKESRLVLSERENAMQGCCSQWSIAHLSFNEFMETVLTDENHIKIYELFKVA